MEDLGNAAVIVSFAGFVAFAVLYGFFAPWRKTAVGRNVLAFMAVCALTIGLSIARMIGGETWFTVHRHSLRLGCYTLVAIVVWWRVWILIRVQTRGGDGA